MDTKSQPAQVEAKNVRKGDLISTTKSGQPRVVESVQPGPTSVWIEWQNGARIRPRGTKLLWHHGYAWEDKAPTLKPGEAVPAFAPRDAQAEDAYRAQLQGADAATTAKRLNAHYRDGAGRLLQENADGSLQPQPTGALEYAQGLRDDELRSELETLARDTPMTPMAYALISEAANRLGARARVAGLQS